MALFAMSPSKYTFIILLSLLFSKQAFSLSFDSDSDYPLIKEAVLTEKCVNYLKTYRRYCSIVASRFFKVIDMNFESSEHPDREHTIIFFENQTRKILADKRLPKYLFELNYRLNNKISGKFPLFDFTAEFLSSKAEAKKWIALLFQDNNYEYHINWLEKNKPLPPNVLEDYLNAYKLFMVTSGLNKKIDFYPKDISKNFSGKIYYYYLTGFLSRELDGIEYLAHGRWNAAQLNELKRVSKALPLMINLIYIYHHMYHSSLKMTFKDPVTLGSLADDGQFVSNGKLEENNLDFTRFEHRYNDLYMSYIASLPFGATPEEFTLFKKRFVENPLLALQYYSYQL